MKFVFHTHKPKARALAEAMLTGSVRAGVDYIPTGERTYFPDRIGIFYGVVHETYDLFMEYRRNKGAIYLDNGWFSSEALPTFRFSWNSAQAFLKDHPMSPESSILRFAELPPLKKGLRKPDNALLILQSRQYFDFLRIGMTRDEWEEQTTRMLRAKGYWVETRDKPNKKDPGARSFFRQMSRAGIVVGFNSAAVLKAMRYGLPGYCTAPSTINPYLDPEVPPLGEAEPLPPHIVNDLCLKLASYEIDKVDLSNGKVFEQIMSVPEEKKRGWWYGPE